MTRTRKRTRKRKVVLTPEQEQAQQLIKKAEEAVEEAEQALQELIKSCTHAQHSLTEQELELLRKHDYKSWSYSSAYCIVCGTDFGWRCTRSPDEVCHYFSRAGFVELINGSKVPVPRRDDEDEYDSRYETEDSCLFCGSPNERK